MTNPRKVELFMLATVFLTTTTMVDAAERRLTRDQLPEAVRQVADERSKGATVRGYATETENGQREYEVEMISNGHSKDVTITPSGSVIEVEEQVDLNTLPPAVKAALEQKAGKGKITKVESITKQAGVAAYEAQISVEGKHSEIQVGPEGQTLNHEE